MEVYVFIALPLVLSVVAFCIGIVTTAKAIVQKRELSISGNLFSFSVWLLVSVWLLRFATGYYMNQNTALFTDSGVGLNMIEHISNTLVHTLQTFSMDEDYTVYLLAGQLMIKELTGGIEWIMDLFRGYSALLNALAPVAGGAILFDVLTRIFPKLRLILTFLPHDYYYFSELNVRSIALAKGIVEEYKEQKSDKTRKNRMRSPVIVFAGACVNPESEECSELYAEAKAMRAICLNEDIARFRGKLFSRNSYFLIDTDEDNNIHLLSHMAEPQNYKVLDNASVYLFSNKESASGIVKSFNKRITDDYGTKIKIPVIRVIQEYKNLVYSLLSEEAPLYEPLLANAKAEEDKKATGYLNADNPQELNVTIIGSGVIGTQMFLAAYWFGQMLGAKLCINIVSQEDYDSFINRINLLNDEIFKTEESSLDGELMRISSGSEDKSPAYFKLRYMQTDVMTGVFFDSHYSKCSSFGDAFALCDSDYFVVATGSDDNNIFIADKLRQIRERHNLKNKTPKHAVIAYVVFDNAISKMLNANSNYKHTYMYAFGDYDSVYSYKNVFMQRTEKVAFDMNNAYRRRSSLSMFEEYDTERMKNFLKDEYSFWASAARALHLYYKLFSADAFEESPLFSDKGRETVMSQAFANYVGKLRDAKDFSDKSADKSTTRGSREKLMLDKLTWLEHRRWCAFMRVMGFTCPTFEQFRNYAYKGTVEHKELSLKLHPCLVEANDKGLVITNVKSDFEAIRTEALRKLSVNSEDDTDEKKFEQALREIIKEKGYDRLDEETFMIYWISDKCVSGEEEEIERERKNAESSGKGDFSDGKSVPRKPQHKRAGHYKKYDTPYESNDGVDIMLR